MQEKNKNHYIVFLDFAKGIAIFSILLFHFFRHVDNLPQFQLYILMLGGVGVHIFLFVSGVGLMLKWKNIEKNQSDKEEKNLNHYESKKYKVTKNVCKNLENTFGTKRKWKNFIKTSRSFYSSQIPKIYIPYIICITIIAIRSTLFPSRGVETNWFQFFSHVFGYKMFFTSLIESYGFHFRFLSTIFQLYLIFPLLVKFFEITPAKNQRILLLFSYLISLGRMLYVALQGHVFERAWIAAFFMFLGEFCMGMRIGQKIHKISNNTAIGNQKEKWEKYFTTIIKNNKYRIIIVTICCLIAYVGITLLGGKFGRVFNDVFAIGWYGGICVLLRYFLEKKTRKEEVGIKIKKYFQWINLKITSFFIFFGKLSYVLYLRHGFVFLLFLKISIYLNIKLTFLRILGGSVLTVLSIIKGYSIFVKCKNQIEKNIFCNKE